MTEYAAVVRRVRTLLAESRYARRLDRVLLRLDAALEEIPTGTNDRPRLRPRIEVAREHADAWAGWSPPRAGTRGGSSSPVEAEERAEIARVARQSASDAVSLPALLDTLKADTAELVYRAHDASTVARIIGRLRLTSRSLDRVIDRLVETIDPRKLPKAGTGLPGCRNCAAAGYFAPVRETALAHGLCDWCYRHALADGREKGLERGEVGSPPCAEAVDLYHRVSPTAAGRYLAELERKKAA